MTSHFCASGFIAYYDLSGKWENFSLKKTKNTAITYLQHVPSAILNWFLILLPCLYMFSIYHYKIVFGDFLPVGSFFDRILHLVYMLSIALINNILNRVIAWAVHWALHRRSLYPLIHKRHHTPLADQVATAAWQDNAFEFLFMEVFGMFIGAPMLFPQHYIFTLVTALCNGVMQATDHSAFYVPGTIVDGRYHFSHHVMLNHSFAEMEMVDRFFGTYRELPFKNNTKYDAEME